MQKLIWKPRQINEVLIYREAWAIGVITSGLAQSEKSASPSDIN